MGNVSYKELFEGKSKIVSLLVLKQLDPEIYDSILENPKVSCMEQNEILSMNVIILFYEYYIEYIKYDGYFDLAQVVLFPELLGTYDYEIYDPLYLMYETVQEFEERNGVSKYKKILKFMLDSKKSDHITNVYAKPYWWSK